MKVEIDWVKVQPPRKLTAVDLKSGQVGVTRYANLLVTRMRSGGLLWLSDDVQAPISPAENIELAEILPPGTKIILTVEN